MNVVELEETLNNRIIETYSLGYSVVEITRAIRKNEVNFVHSLLRDTGHIQTMERSEYRRKYDIDGRLTEVLRKKGYTFGRWCLSWKFDPESAVADLKIAPEKSGLTATHRALQRDFPNLFFTIYGGSRRGKGKKKVKKTALPPSLRIDWNDDKKLYVATIPEHPMVETFGIDWDEAYFDIKTAYRLVGQIIRLNHLIDNHTRK